MSERLIMLTGDNGFFGQTRKPWVSLDSGRMADLLREEGFDAEIRSLSGVVNDPEPLERTTLFYTFSQKRNLRQYIGDLIAFLDNGSNRLIPSRELLRCHENKGFQELYKRRYGIPSLPAWYFSSPEESETVDLPFPLVLKDVEGSNGKAVYLVENREALRRILYQRFVGFSLPDRLDLFRRRYLRKKKTYPEYPDYSNRTDFEQYRPYVRREQNFVLQTFVPGLTSDYRVLAVHDRYYVMGRWNREGDFRASGAKKFRFDITPDPALLDFARTIYGMCGTPYLSMDIAESGGQYHLFEFQALHFGMNVICKNRGYWLRSGKDWHFFESDSDLESTMVYGLAGFLKSEGNVQGKPL